MTRKEAIMKLEMLIDLSQQNELKNMHEALSMAIRSLEAWDEVLLELQDELESTYVWESTYEYEKGQIASYEYAIESIKEHLKEVEYDKGRSN